MDWQIIALVLLTAIAGGLFAKLRRVQKEFSEFVGDMKTALEDGKITGEELTHILKEAEDVKDAVVAVAQLFKK